MRSSDPLGRPIPAPADITLALRDMHFRGQSLDEMARLLGAAYGLPDESVRALTQGDLVRALPHLESAEVSEETRGEPRYWLLYAACLAEAGEQDRAREAISDCLAKTDGRATSSFQAWQLARQLGEVPAADQADHVLGVVVEIGTQEGLLMVVAWQDGSAGLYHGAGGGVIGGPTQQRVRRATQALVLEAQLLPEGPPLVTEHPLPAVDEVCFTLLTPSGARAAAVTRNDLADRDCALFPLYLSCRTLITELERIAEDHPESAS